MYYILKIESNGNILFFWGFNSQGRAIWKTTKKGICKYNSYEEASEDREHFSIFNTVIEKLK